MIDIAILTFEPFPFGMAATNRFTSWAKVLVKSGYSVKVIVIRPTENPENVINVSTSGNFEGIQYQYLSKDTIWLKTRTKLSKFVILCNGYFNLIRELYRDKPKTITTYSADLVLKVIVIALKPFLKFRLVIEETEFPKILKTQTNSLHSSFFLGLYKYSDAMLVMTDELQLYYTSLGVKNIMVLPMSVDISRFEGLTHTRTSLRYFLYLGGSGGFIRDGVFEIVRVFHLSKVYLNGVKLFIGGEFETSALLFRQITDYIDENSLTDYILFLGAQHPSKVPGLLMGSTGIIMLPQSDFHSGGFPTKLGEFLASGRPVICTAVSEIPLYLNGSNSYLIKPGDFEAAAGAIIDIISNPVKASQIGLCGRELALKEFNPDFFAEDLIDFLQLDQNQD